MPKISITMNKSINKIQSLLGLRIIYGCVILCIIIVNSILYLTINPASNHSAPLQSRKDAAGFSFSKAEKFAYFHYYTGDFPLATLNTDLKYSVKDAELEIEENGEDLIMEFQHWSRLGENARIWAFLPNSILAGSPQNPSIKLFNVLIFTFSLIILYTGFWKSKHALYGLILVIIINSTPFFHFEVFANNNIFAIIGSVFFIILGLNISLILNNDSKFIKALIIAFFSGSIIGFFSEFRNEISVLIVSLIFIYLLSNRIKFIFKLSLILVSFLTFYGSKMLIRNHFNHKFEKTTSLVENHHGHVYTGKRIPGHKFWHPVFCGLGDFDTEHGYAWNDIVAYKYAVPILQNEYKMDIAYSGLLHLDNYYDQDSLYYIKFDEIDDYETILKNKVLSDIGSNPLWYFKILGKRFIRTLSVTIPIPYVGWLIFFILFRSFKKQIPNYHIKLIAISLPLSVTSMLIYSGDGATYNSVFVYFVIMAIIFMLFNPNYSWLFVMKSQNKK